jgi:SAM-dependent methyltransferase
VTSQDPEPVTTAEDPHGRSSSVVEMYADWSADYDLIMRPAERLAAHQAWLLQTLTALGARTVVDAAAGTGAQTAALVQAGTFDRVVCNDLSGDMLERCRAKVLAQSPATTTRVEFHNTDWSQLHLALPPAAADVVICLGDSLSHAASLGALEAAFQGWAQLLRVGGYVLIDHGVWFATEAAAMRRDEFVPPPAGWAIDERDLLPGGAHVLGISKAFVQRPGAPLGWCASIRTIKAVFSTPPRVSVHQHEYMILDRTAIVAAAATAGLEPIDLPCGPSPRLGVRVADMLLRRC